MRIVVFGEPVVKAGALLELDLVRVGRLHAGVRSVPVLPPFSGRGSFTFYLMRRQPFRWHGAEYLWHRWPPPHLESRDRCYVGAFTRLRELVRPGRARFRAFAGRPQSPLLAPGQNPNRSVRNNLRNQMPRIATAVSVICQKVVIPDGVTWPLPAEISPAPITSRRSGTKRKMVPKRGLEPPRPCGH